MDINCGEGKEREIPKGLKPNLKKKTRKKQDRDTRGGEKMKKRKRKRSKTKQAEKRKLSNNKNHDKY